MTEHDDEPIPGLPGVLPPGERILWQGAPDHRVLARTAFHTRLVGGYFALLASWAFVGAAVEGIDGPNDLVGTAMTIIAGIVGVGLLHLLAWGSARTTIYTLTDRRIVMRVGMAVPKCVNLPLATIASVDLAARADGTGDVALTLLGTPRIGYAALWPHARPFTIARPKPMLRALPDAERVAALVARYCLAACPDGRPAPVAHDHVPMPAFAEARAA